ncbi:MAG: extracellular solute-binding protein [Acidisphaera sp.]|nr:extracellular solute-binding protein [Acidisphaera sp.]
MLKSPITRRSALQLGAASAALPLVHIRTAGAAGKLSVGFWDHWVPQGNDVMKKQVQAWSDKNKVDVQSDFITTVGNKLQLTAAAESQAGTGHDIMTFLAWDAHNNAQKLAPVNDVVKALTDKYGPVNEASSYLASSKGNWFAVPSSSGTQNKPSCARISLLKKFAGIDVQAWYPAQEVQPPEAAEWTYDTLLSSAEKLQKAGFTYGIGLGQTPDSVDWTGAMFAAFGAELIDGEGNVRIKSDAVRQVLEYSQKLVKFLPADAVSYDDASNNRALISGQSALIFNPPSAWAVAKRDAPQVAADCWTFSSPAGPKGRFVPHVPFLWGVWKFSQNQSAAKDLLQYLMQREQVEERDNVVQGYDLPPFPSMNNFKVWQEVEPPKGTVFNYPTLPWHQAKPSVAASSASPDIAVQIYNRGTMPTMLAKLQSGQTIPQVIAWASDELEGFTR